MSNTSYDEELDAILREFSNETAVPTVKAEPPKTAERAETPAGAPARRQEPVPVTKPERPAAPARREVEPRPVRQDVPARRETAPARPENPARRVPMPDSARRERQTMPQESQRPARRMPPAEPRPVREAVPEKPQSAARPVAGILAALFFLLSMFSFVWLTFNLHPDTGTAAEAKTEKRANLMEKLNTFMNNSASDALSDLTYIKKIYTIPEGQTVAPAPDQAKFGETDDPAVVRAVIDGAGELINGRTLSWNENVHILAGSKFRYYCDDTILAISWIENIEGKACTCGEVIVADGSQLRRKIADDSYGSGVRLTATDMAKQVNAVFAINGDFYTFRDLGITAYQRQVYRFAPESVDSCFFTASGDMLFSRAGEMKTKEEAQKFVDDNDVTFAVAFGPVLVDNGELQSCSKYPIGEIQKNYSRAAIGMIDDLHYFTMNVNYADGFTKTCTLDQCAKFMYDKGCVKAYALDGGQTSVAIMNGTLVNHVDFGSERTMSDIIYFATAIPETEVSK